MPFEDIHSVNVIGIGDNIQEFKFLEVVVVFRQWTIFLIDAIRILPINVFEALENSNEVFLLAPEIDEVPEIEGIFQPRTDEYPFRGKARDVRQDPQKIVFRYNMEEDIETQYDRLTKN